MSVIPDSPRATTATVAGVFAIALATLMYEILLTRIFSVTMWYHFAFVAISVAMFGMAAGALAVFVRADYFTSERARYHLALSSGVFAVSIVLLFGISKMRWLSLAYGLLLYAASLGNGIIYSLGPEFNPLGLKHLPYSIYGKEYQVDPICPIGTTAHVAWDGTAITCIR